MCCRCCGETQRKLWVFGIGTLVVIFGLIIGLLWPTLSLKLLHENLELRPGSMNYDNWMKTPIPMYFDVYLFNWTNPDELGNEDFKPSFTEYGPLVYSEKHTRVDIKWNTNGTVTFNQIREWHFEKELSNGTLEEPITHANVITATVAHMMRSQKPVIKKVVNYLLNKRGGSLLWTKPAGQWIFDGFEDDLLTFLKKVNSSMINIPFKKFGWLVDRNMSKTYDGRFQMNTGTDDINKLGYLNQWNGANTTQFYEGQCGAVHGSTGEIWQPAINTSDYLTVFASDICRSVDIYPAGDYSVLGVSGTIWKPSNLTLDNGQISEENKCYCPKDDDCPKNGVVDVSKCRWGAPVAFSFPHFYLADPSYVEAVEGINPDEKKHEFFMALEPTAGIPLSVNAKFQINMKLQHIEGIDIYENVKKEVLIPMFWFNQRAQLNEEFASKAKLAVALPVIGLGVGYGLCGLGAVVLIIGIVLTILKKWGGSYRDDTQPFSDAYVTSN